MDKNFDPYYIMNQLIFDMLITPMTVLYVQYQLCLFLTHNKTNKMHKTVIKLYLYIFVCFVIKIIYLKLATDVTKVLLLTQIYNL